MPIKRSWKVLGRVSLRTVHLGLELLDRPNVASSLKNVAQLVGWLTITME
jgi:hypothetical protein